MQYDFSFLSHFHYKVVYCKVAPPPVSFFETPSLGDCQPMLLMLHLSVRHSYSPLDVNPEISRPRGFIVIIIIYVDCLTSCSGCFHCRHLK